MRMRNCWAASRFPTITFASIRTLRGVASVPKHQNLFIPAAHMAVTQQPTAGYIDAHTHLHWVVKKHKFALSNSVPAGEALNRLRAELFPELQACVNVLCDYDSFRDERWRELVSGNDWLYLSVGIHPHNAIDYTDQVESEILDCMLHDRVVAWGEMGLDYYRLNSPKEVQISVFARQLQMAVQVAQKPLVIHTRQADEDTYRLLVDNVPKDWKIHVHCFTDSLEFAQKLLSYFPNLCLGFTGVVTFASAGDVQEVVKYVPMNRILLETDAPYMIPRTPEVKKGTKYAHSGMIPLVAKKIAALKQLSVEEVMRIAGENAQRLYGIHATG